MGSDDEFGPDTLAIRAWLEKRAEYTADRDRPRPVGARTTDLPPLTPDVHAIGRSLLDQLRDEPEPDPWSVAEPIAEPVTEPAAEPELKARPAPPRAVEHVPTPPPFVTEPPHEDDLPPAVITFKPRTRARRFLAVVLLLALTATALSAAIAAQNPTAGTLAVTVVLGLLLLVVWAVRASATPTRLTVRRNHLEVVRRGERRLIDLASPYTPVAVVGRPDRRGWQVLIEQLDAPLLTLTSADVEPEPFLRVLYRLRPDVWTAMYGDK